MGTRCRSEAAPAPGVVHSVNPVAPTCRRAMRPIKLLGPIVLAAVVAGMTQSVPPRPLTDLRICGDPYNMPFSNDREEGFENKIAHVVAQDLNATVINYWWPERRGFLRNSILAGFCDVLINVPVGLDPVATTKAYYRSTYYFVYRTDRGLNLHSLDDTLLKHLKIGVNMIGYDYTNTPPAHALGSRGVVGLVGFGNFLNPDPKADHPQDIVDAVAKDSIDVAIVWGPKAGYWVKREAVPLTMVPLPDSDAVSGMPFAFDMAMGVRHRDKALKAQLDSVIDRRRGEIVAILRDYSVPMLEPHP
ncbi:MAG: quinoprotein dehydrogenase-associated putative ABC transporter substrate-binding protein [Gemmatimonadetes bacterium]|nr:MAG: quinoprotein dehydrogenase-associated putative ABC transporter substrate-binding protein [Gemmatimonadota bacterium]